MFRKKTGKALVAGGTPRVSLFPPKEVEKRARQALRVTWLKAFIAAFVVVALAWLVGFQWNRLAHNDVDRNAQESVRLQSQLADYSEVINLQVDIQELRKLRTQAGSNDLRWWPLIAEIKAVLPTGVKLTGFKAATGGATLPGSAASAEVGLRGTLTLSAKTTSALAETITQLRTVKGFIDVDASGLSSDGQGGGFTFMTTFRADQTRYTGRFEEIGSK